MKTNRIEGIGAFSIMAGTLAFAAGCFIVCSTAGATVTPANIGTLDTGYGMSGASAGATDPNWTVTYENSGNAGGTGGNPPGGIPGGTAGTAVPAYWVPSSLTGPTNAIPEWAANYSTTVAGGAGDNPNNDGLNSSWITYASPTPDGVDQTGDAFMYELKFIAGGSGEIGISFLSDNVGTLYLNGVDLGNNSGNPDIGMSGIPNTDAIWTSFFDVPLLSGSSYTLDLDVVNIPDGTQHNPTGVRVDLTPVDPVPDAGSTLVMLGATALGIALLRRFLVPTA